jgi:hypothetical protein
MGLKGAPPLRDIEVAACLCEQYRQKMTTHCSDGQL